jgi:hypothetical protein
MEKKQSDRVYPLSLFIFGLLTNSMLVLLGSLLFVVILFSLRIFFVQIPIYVPYLPLVVWFVKSLVVQINIRKAALEISDNEEFNEYMDFHLNKANRRNKKQKTFDTTDENTSEHERQ